MAGQITGVMDLAQISPEVGLVSSGAGNARARQYGLVCLRSRVGGVSYPVFLKKTAPLLGGGISTEGRISSTARGFRSPHPPKP